MTAVDTGNAVLTFRVRVGRTAELPTPQVAPQVAPQVEAALQCARETPTTRSSLQEATGIALLHARRENSSRPSPRRGG
jgi:hypothetical protein